MEEVSNLTQDTSRHGYRLESNSVQLSQVKVSSLSVTHQINRISTAQLIIVDGDAAAGDFPQAKLKEIQPGKTLTVKLGYGDDFREVFTGIVVSHSIKVFRNKPSILLVELKHEAVKLAHSRQNIVYQDKTDSDIARAIAQRYPKMKLNWDGGFSGGPKPATVTHEQQVQYNVSDWDYLVMRAEANGRFVYTRKPGIFVSLPQISPVPEKTITFGDNVFDFDGLMDGRTQFEDVKGSFWDYSKQEAIDVFTRPSDLSRTPESGSAKSSTLAGDLSQGSYNLVHSGIAQSDEFKNWAGSVHQRVRLSKIRGKVTIQGVSGLEPGGTIALKGFGPVLNGNAFVSGVCHKLVPGNWYTEIEFGVRPDCFAKAHDVVDEPVSGLTSPMQGIQIGVVVDNVDDDKLHRVLVKLPYMGKDKTVWARVMQPDAGKEHGVFFHPQKDDEVIVGFLNQDPNSPIVLGSLVNTNQNPPPFEDKESKEPGKSNLHKVQGIKTKNGILVELNDEDKTVLISTPGNNQLLLSDKTGENGILLKDANGNQIVMDSSGISIKSGDGKAISIEASTNATLKGLNVTAEGTTSFKGKGGAASLEATGTALIKGSIINIG